MMIIINGIEMDDGVDEPNDNRTENVTAVTPPETLDCEMPTNPVWQALALHGLIPKTMNYNRGNNGTFAVAHDNSLKLQMELDRLCKLAELPIETTHEQMTNAEARWLFSVIRERPAWSHPTLARYGYKPGDGQ